MNKNSNDMQHYLPTEPARLSLAESGTEGNHLEVFESERLQKILSFSVNNEELDRLYSLIGAFNPFSVLGLENHEIRHSNVLAWLLSPSGHHGFGDNLLRRVLLEVLKSARNSSIPNFPGISDIVNADFSDLKVLREWHDIDLFAISHKSKIAVVIENKWRDKEREKQLSAYADFVDSKYSDYNKVFLFLTLDGAYPVECDRYERFTYEQIYNIVQSVVRLKKDYMHEKVYDFIEQYLQVLERETMQNDELTRICTSLYMKHKEAINYICDYGTPKPSREIMEEFHKKTETESYIMSKSGSTNKGYNFIPSAWSDSFPSKSVISNKYLVHFTLNFDRYEDHIVRLILLVKEFDEDARTTFMKNLRAEAEEKKQRFSGKLSGKKETILFNEMIKLTDKDGDYISLDNSSAIVERLVEVYRGDSVQNQLRVVDSIVKNPKKRGWG